MNKKLCTSIEQSKKLLDLGIDIKTADMYYLIRRDDCRVPLEEALKNTNDVILYPREILTGNLSDYRHPAWSFTALFEMMPYATIMNEDGNYFISYRGHEWQGAFSRNSSAIDAAFTMMCHLLENNYITFKKKVVV